MKCREVEHCHGSCWTFKVHYGVKRSIIDIQKFEPTKTTSILSHFFFFFSVLMFVGLDSSIPYAYNHLEFSLHWKNHLRTTTISFGMYTAQNCFKMWHEKCIWFIVFLVNKNLQVGTKTGAWYLLINWATWWFSFDIFTW